MLSPIAANPVYWGAPLFPAIVYGIALRPGSRSPRPRARRRSPQPSPPPASAKPSKSRVILRFSVRTRGAMIGLMSWAGYASFMLFLVGLFLVARLVTALGKPLLFLSGLPWPSGLSLLRALHSGLAPTAATPCSPEFSPAGSPPRSASPPPSASASGVRNADLAGAVNRDKPRSVTFRRADPPLRQGSALPQRISLVPPRSQRHRTKHPHPAHRSRLPDLQYARRLLVKAQGEWNYLCGAAILFGTYFLWILGPKSLASEGQALWIPLTWPRGLESLLKAKAWLWSLIASGVVAARSPLRHVPLSRRHLAHRARRHRLVLLRPLHGREVRHPRDRDLRVRRGPAYSLGTPRRDPARHAHLRHRRAHPAVAHRRHGHRLFLDHRRRPLAELPRPPALPLRSLERKAAAAAHHHARDGRHQPPRRGRRDALRP